MIHERALLVLVREWERQLIEALERAKALLPDPEPQRERVWTNTLAVLGNLGRAPTENDNPDLWMWQKKERTAPPLVELEAVIDRIGVQITEMAGTE